MKIVICGSMKFMEQMLEIKKSLEQSGHVVDLPTWENLHLAGLPREEFLTKKKEYILTHFVRIKENDAILVPNFTKNGITNYIGGNTLVEIGIAFEHGKQIFIYNQLPPPEELSYVDEIEAMQPIVLNGDLSKIQQEPVRV